MKLTLLSIPAALLLGSTLFAGTTALAPLEIVSSPFNESELSASRSVEVYTAEEIAKANVQSIYEFLNLKSSVITMPGYGNPFMQKIDMRGYGIGDGYQNIVITVNGRRMNNIDMVPQLLASLSPASIERIEIIKGSGIVGGGDGANAGVINIITKKGDQSEVTLYGGNYNTYSGSFYLGKTSDKVALSVLGDAYHTDGPRTIDAKGNSDEQKLANGRADLSYMPSDSLELRAAGQFSKTDATYAGYLSKAEYDENPYQAGATNWGATRQKYESIVAELGARYDVNAQWKLAADATREKKKSIYVAWNSIANARYDAAKIAAEYKGEQLFYSLGAEYRKGERSSAVEIAKQNLAGFGELKYLLGAQTLSAGYRFEKVNFDNNKEIDKSDTLQGFELGYNLKLGAAESLFVNYTHSFQSADIDRMFSYSTGAFNGYVEPSQADTYTLGYNAISEGSKFKAALFYTQLKNEIYYYSNGLPWWDPAAVSANTNIDASSKYGLELYEHYLISDAWSAAVTYSYLQARIDKESYNGDSFDGNALPGVSDHNLKVALSYQPGERSVITLTQLYRSEAYAANDFGNNFAQKQEAFKSTDLSANYTAEGYELFAKINNLFAQKNGLWIQDDAIYPVNFTRTFTAGFKLKY